MVQQINEARWGGKEQYKKAHLIQRKWKCRGLATLASAVKEKKKKINTTNSYLQKTLEAYNIQTQDKRNSFVCNENCTRDEKNGSFYRYRGLYMYMRKIN